MKSVAIATLIASSIIVAIVIVVGLAATATATATATAASSGVVATHRKDETSLQRRLGQGPGQRNLNPRGRMLNSQRLYQDRRALNTDVKTETDTVKTTTDTAGGASVADPFDCFADYEPQKPYV